MYPIFIHLMKAFSLFTACMFLISSVKAPEKAQTMVFKELQHEEPGIRINAVIRSVSSQLLVTYNKLQSLDNYDSLVSGIKKFADIIAFG